MGQVPREYQTARVPSTAALTTENDNEGKDPIYNRPKADKTPGIKSDQVNAEFIWRKQ